MHRRKLLLVGLLSILGVAVGSATGNAKATAEVPQASNGSVIYSDLGPGGSYNPGGLAVCETRSCGIYQALAMPFTGNGTWATQIDVGLSHANGANNATIELAKDNGAGQPGPVLGSWPVADQPQTCGCSSSQALTTIHLSPWIRVAAGDEYWVAVFPGPSAANNADDVWGSNPYSATGPFAFTHSPSGGVWFNGITIVAAFDVLGCGKVCKV